MPVHHVSWEERLLLLTLRIRGATTPESGVAVGLLQAAYALEILPELMNDKLTKAIHHLLEEKYIEQGVQVGEDDPVLYLTGKGVELSTILRMTGRPEGLPVDPPHFNPFLSLGTLIDRLNSMVKVDRKAMETLMEHRVPCNTAMADHPTVQVLSEPEGAFSVGLLGIINGLFGVQGAGGPGYVAAVYTTWCPACGWEEGEEGNVAVGFPCPKCGNVTEEHLQGFEPYPKVKG